jgi:hypothetical protein
VVRPHPTNWAPTSPITGAKRVSRWLTGPEVYFCGGTLKASFAHVGPSSQPNRAARLAVTPRVLARFVHVPAAPLGEDPSFGARRQKCAAHLS